MLTVAVETDVYHGFRGWSSMAPLSPSLPLGLGRCKRRVEEWRRSEKEVLYIARVNPKPNRAYAEYHGLGFFYN